MQNRIEKERRFWDQFSGNYDSFIKKTVGAAYQQMFRQFREDISPNDEVLEIATGTGLLAFEISQYAKKITAVDISSEMIKQAKQKQLEKNYPNILFEVSDACELPLKNASFDVVLASNVLHLLYEPEKSMEQIKRVLKQSGKAIIPTFCHAENFKSLIISAFMGIFGFKAINKWSVKSYCSFIEKSGFSIEKIIIIQSKIPLVYLVVKSTENTN